MKYEKEFPWIGLVIFVTYLSLPLFFFFFFFAPLSSTLYRNSQVLLRSSFYYFIWYSFTHLGICIRQRLYAHSAEDWTSTHLAFYPQLSTRCAIFTFYQNKLQLTKCSIYVNLICGCCKLWMSNIWLHSFCLWTDLMNSRCCERRVRHPYWQLRSSIIARFMGGYSLHKDFSIPLYFPLMRFCRFAFAKRIVTMFYVHAFVSFCLFSCFTSRTTEVKALNL